MSEQNTIVIKQSKIKQVLMLLGCLGFVCAGISFMLNPEKYLTMLVRSTKFIFFSGLIGVAFFGFIAFAIIKKLNDSSPGLIVSNAGIIDNSGGLPAGFIPWSEILKIKEQEIARQKFMAIIVKTPQTYIDRQKNSVNKKLMQLNLKKFGAAIGISANNLQVNHERLKSILEESFAQYS